MRTGRKLAALLLAAVLLLSAARAESWQAAQENIQRFGILFDLLRASAGGEMDTEAADRVLKNIRAANEADYRVAQAATDHWCATVLDAGFRMLLWRGEERALTLERSGLDFSGKHAFVVLGYQLQNGEMTEELKGRCGAAAAAARSFPDAVLVCTGGATGANNPLGHTEAGMMKEYLADTCGIDSRRIYTDPDAMTTADNAVNTFRIMREAGIRTYTLVTSDYHQVWAQILFNGMGAVMALGEGEPIRMVGNYNYQAQPWRARTDYSGSGLSQLSSLLRRKIDIGP